jgi:hypothetical protein
MGTKSREPFYGSSMQASAERVREARKEADKFGCKAWNQRMLGDRDPAQRSPTLPHPTAPTGPSSFVWLGAKFDGWLSQYPGPYPYP